jgi:phosphatidylglycerophosphate synthase
MGQGLGGVSCPNQRDAQSDLGGERPFRRGRRGVGGVQARCDRPYRVRRRLVCNLLDGMVAIEGGKKSSVGSLYNEFPDRIADSLFIVALGYAVGWPALGWFGALAAALTAYVRVFGGSLGFAQDFRGPMAKQQRMAVLTAACVVGAAEWLFTGTQYALIAAAVIIAAGSVVTCVTRTLAIAAKLKGS